MRVLAVDYGFSRIGIAVGETDPGIASPRLPLAASGSLRTDADHISESAKKEEAERIVVGLPIEPDGKHGRMARVCTQLVKHLTDLGWTVAVVDERLSSVSADAQLREEGLKASQRRKRIDGEAAAVIFQRYVDEQISP